MNHNRLGAPKKDPKRRLSRQIGIRVKPHEHDLWRSVRMPKEYLRRTVLNAIVEWAQRLEGGRPVDKLEKFRLELKELWMWLGEAQTRAMAGRLTPEEKLRIESICEAATETCRTINEQLHFIDDTKGKANETDDSSGGRSAPTGRVP